MQEYAARFASQERKTVPVGLAAQDRRLCLGAMLRWISRQYRHGKPVLRRELAGLAALADDSVTRKEPRR
jgi:hypothetical protein